STTGVLRFTWTTLWLVEIPPLARHRWRLAMAAYSTYPSNRDVGLTLSWRMPVNLPSRSAPRAIVCTVAGWWPAIEYICARVSCTRTGRFATFAASAASNVCGQDQDLP